jgi:4-aminobutyrate aminotransferase
MLSDYPKIKTRLPGPKSKKLINFDKSYISPSYTRIHPVVLDHADGALVWDVDGNCFIDFHAGIAVCSTGNCHPKVVEAVRRQAGKAIHISTADFYHELVGALAKELSDLVPIPGKCRTFFTNSGTETVECAIKLARYKTRRPRFIAFIGGFHGRTMGSLALTCSKATQRQHFSPMMGEVTHVPYPYLYRDRFNTPGRKNTAREYLRYIEEEIFGRVAPAEDVAAVIVEPVQGEGGYVVPPPDFFPGLAELCKKYGILLILDEIQSGMGRTGKMFAIEHWNVQPDIICLAKALGSGLPLGACVASREVMDWPPGVHSTTFGGNPLGCAAALATIDLLKNGLVDNAAEQGAYLLRELKKMQKRHWSIGDVRGLGLMIGIEFVLDKKTKERAGEIARSVMMECFHRGLMLLTCGPNSIRFAPPLVVDRKMCKKTLEIFERAITAIEQKTQRR